MQGTSHKGRTALITGSTSGIGLGIARAFASQGANLIFNGFGDAKEIDAMQARVRDEFGLNMTCGASNVSFGMPNRHTLGAAFLPMAMTAGLTSAIMDTRTPAIVEGVKAADLLLGHDDWGMAWIAAHRKKLAADS